MNDVGSQDVLKLLNRARAGDGRALGTLLELYQGYLALLVRMQCDKQLRVKVSPSDVVQETFLVAKQRFREFRGCSEGELVAWLRRILASQIMRTVRHFSSQRRDMRLERSLCDRLDESSDRINRCLVTDDTSPSQCASRREQAVLLADALARIPAEYREVILLRHFDCLTFPEVARRMGRSEDSVKKLWKRGMLTLRRELQPSI